jgi:hypothetical protein
MIITKKNKMVGVYMPQPISDYISLFALGSNDGNNDKSKVIREVITEWFNNTNSIHPVSKLLDNIATKYCSIYNHEKDGIMEMTKFLDIVKSELAKKGINLDYTNKIINLIYEKTNKFEGRKIK